MNTPMNNNPESHVSRRDFLKITSVAAASAAIPGIARAEETKPPVRIGSGAYAYEAVDGWGKLPAGMKYGFGCGVVAFLGTVACIFLGWVMPLRIASRVFNP